MVLPIIKNYEYLGKSKLQQKVFKNNLQHKVGDRIMFKKLDLVFQIIYYIFVNWINLQEITFILFSKLFCTFITKVKCSFSFPPFKFLEFFRFFLIFFRFCLFGSFNEPDRHQFKVVYLSGKQKNKLKKKKVLKKVKKQKVQID